MLALLITNAGSSQAISKVINGVCDILCVCVSTV